MPITHSSPRRAKRLIVSHSDLESAHRQVFKELVNLGCWSPRLEPVEVRLVSGALTAYGWYQGHIYIPRVNGAQLTDWIFGRHTRLTDILRHEWGHAIADYHPEFIDTRSFRQAFGADYEYGVPVYEYDRDHHVTPYAATQPCEDFAEVFHHYIRHKGRLPIRLSMKPVIARKWDFISRLAKRVSSCRS